MSNQLISSFAGGEVSSDLYGRYESELYPSTSRRMENWIPRVQGPMEFRSGTEFNHPSRQNKVFRRETFKFNDAQTYGIEFTDGKVRIFDEGSVLLESSGKTITGATAADPVVITATSHGFSDGDEVYISGVVGMAELNGRFFRVANKTTDTFELQDLYDDGVDGAAFTAYASGGTATKVYELTSPYLEADLFEFQFAQQGNTIRIVHRSYAPYDLKRVSATSWTLATFSRTNDPFTGAGDYPGCVAFYEGRCLYGSTDNNPDTIYGTRSPDNAGSARYEDHTIGTSAADDAFAFPISSSQGDISYINWLAGIEPFVAIGTTGGVSALDGGGSNEAITPTTLRVRPIDPYGCQSIMPITNGSQLFYMQKGSRVFRGFEYEILSDAYRSTDRSFLDFHMTVGGVKQLAFSRGRTDTIYLVREDGTLIAASIKPKEDPSGWYRIKVGGPDAKVITVTVEPVVRGYDKVIVGVERTINGTTVRYHESLTDPFESPIFEDFYTGVKETDITDFQNAMFEAQRVLTYLDCHAVSDGSVISGNPTVTPSAVSGDAVTFTASGAAFAASDVGKEIWKKYADRAGGGRAVITAYTSSTVVTAKVIVAFDSTDAIAAGQWYLTTNTFGGLHQYEGLTVQVMADGRPASDVVVTNGTVTISRQAGFVVVGFKYVGFFISQEIVMISRDGPLVTNRRNIDQFDIVFYQSLGVKFGTDPYKLALVPPSKQGQKTDRPPLPFSGVVPQTYRDTWAQAKQIYIVQELPYPAKINAIILETDVGEE